MAAADHLPLITNSPLDSVRVHAPRINTHIFRMQNKYFINTNMCKNQGTDAEPSFFSKKVVFSCIIIRQVPVMICFPIGKSFENMVDIKKLLLVFNSV